MFDCVSQDGVERDIKMQGCPHDEALGILSHFHTCVLLSVCASNLYRLLEIITSVFISLSK